MAVNDNFDINKYMFKDVNDMFDQSRSDWKREQANAPWDWAGGHWTSSEDKNAARNAAREGVRSKFTLDAQNIFRQAASNAVLSKHGEDTEDSYAQAKYQDEINRQLDQMYNVIGYNTDDSDSDKTNRDAMKINSARAIQDILKGHDETKNVDIQSLFDGQVSGSKTPVDKTLSDLISGQSAIDVKKQSLEQIQGMGQAFMQSQLAAANQNIYAQRQQMLEAQRKYGITGAVANAQAQDFELKAQQQLSQISNNAALQWYQQAGSQIAGLNQEISMMQTAQARGIVREYTQRHTDGTPNISRQSAYEQLKDIATQQGKTFMSQDEFKNIDKTDLWERYAGTQASNVEKDKGVQ